MSKRKPIILKGEIVDQRPFGPHWNRTTKIEYVGGTKTKYRHYIRLECDGMYLGSFEKKDLVRFKKWIDSALA